MVDKIVMKSDNCFIVVFTNRSPITVNTDNNSALHLIESLLSPRADLTYSEYISIIVGCKEDTQPCFKIEEVA